MKFLLNLILLIYLCILCASFSSCEPETIIETETVTVNDTLIVSTTDTLTISTTDTLIVSTTDTVFISTVDTLVIPDDAKGTTFILLRHAEISIFGNDPVLTQAGIERVEKLADMLSQIELDRVYSTNFNRTSLTAMPTADSQGLSISNYGGFDHEEVIDDILENVNEGIVLIVGHGNTTANFLNALTGTSDYPDLSEDAFDNLFIVSTKSKGDSEVLHLKY